MEHKKPTGKLGIFSATGHPDGTLSGQFQKIGFPKNKAAIEREVAEGFVRALKEAADAGGYQPFFSDLAANPENDLDFAVTTARGPARLELTETAVLDGPYENAPTSHCTYDFAKNVLQKILEKSRSYSRGEQFLLLYATHFTFTLSDSEIYCLRVWLNENAPAFNAVFYFSPFTSTQGLPFWLYPVPPNMREGVDPEIFRGKTCYTLDPGKWEVVSK
jgi:hypothetical protein